MCKYKLGKREGKRPEKKNGMEKEKEEGRERKKERERERGGGREREGERGERERKQGYFTHTAHAQYINVHNIMCV